VIGRWYACLGDNDIEVTVEDDGTVSLDVNDTYYSCTMTKEQATEMAHAILRNP